MKTLVFTLGTLFLTTSFTPVKPTPHLQQQNQRRVAGYVFHQGNARDITLILVRTQSGWKCINYYMEDPIVRVYEGQMGDGERLVPLNPNNNLALTYNFTHYVSTPQGTAYLNINSY